MAYEVDIKQMIQALYIAYWGRPGDPEGLTYWLTQYNNGVLDLAGIADNFAMSQEAQDEYAYFNAVFNYPALLTDEMREEFVKQVYQNIFERDPDADGLAYWTEQLKNAQTPGQFIAHIIYTAYEGRNGTGQTATDWLTLYNKIQVAEYFTDYLVANNIDWTMALSDQVEAVLDTVTSTSDVDAVNQQVEDIITGQGSVGQTFTLSSGTDLADENSSSKAGVDTTASFKFSSANETVIAGAGTLNTGDVLLDPSTSDNDVLNATVTSAPTPTLQNIETINLTVATASAGIGLTSVTGTKTVTLTGSANGTITGIDATSAPTIEIKDYTKTATLEAATLAGTNDALTVKVSGMTGSSTVTPGITLDTAAAGTLETFNLESAGASKNTVALALDTTAPVVTAVTKTVVTGAADLDLRVDHGLINGQKLDASGHTGALNLIVDRNAATTATTNLTNVTGVDTYTFRDSTAGGDALVASGLVNNANVVLTYSTTGASSLAVKGAGAGSSDVVNLRLDHATDATDIAVATSLTINDVETINITSEGGTSTGNSITALTVNAGSKVTVDGSTKLDLQLAAASTVASVTVNGAGNHKVDFAGAATYTEGKNLTIDGSAATGKLTLDGSDFKGTALGSTETLTILGGSNDDTITGTSDTNSKNVIDGGAGVDTVTVRTASLGNNVTLGAGADKITIKDVIGTSAVVFTDFALGSGGDVLSVDTAEAMTFGGVGAASVANKLIILNAAVADDAAAKSAADGTSAGERAIIVINNSSGVAELWYDPNGNQNANDAVKLAVFENITTVGVLTDTTNGFIAANFGTWA